MATNTLPTAEYLRQCFAYDPETGVLTWRYRPREHFASYRGWRAWLARYADKAAGCSIGTRGYVYVTLKTTKRGHYEAHRLIWKIMTGEDPTSQVDHRNRINSDNRWDNLREATSRQNLHNRRTRGAVPVKGVHRSENGKRYIAQARDNNGRRVHLGSFATAEAAHEAFVRFVQPLRGDFYHPD